MKDQTSISDGSLHYKTTFQANHGLVHFFNGTSNELHVTPVKAELNDTLLYSITAPVVAASGDDSGYSNHMLGKPLDYTRWFSLVRLWSPWLAPRQGKGKFAPDKEGVLAAFLRNDGLHVVCLAVSGVQDVMTTFTHDNHGRIMIRGRNDLTEAGTSRVLVAVADSFETANAAVMYQARHIIADNPATASQNQQEIDALTENNVDEAVWIEEWCDGLTYCTWNALGQDLHEDKIFDALDILDREGIKIANLIIDDNWQSLSEGETQFDRAWMEFEATKKGFPRGLKACVTDIRNKHPNVGHIAVWHAILGYWGGVSPNGKIAKHYKTIKVQKEPGVAEGEFTVVDASDAQRMYQDFYKFLSSAGITAVKTDAQFFLDLLSQAPARRALTTEYQDAWTLAHLRNFSSRAISCMSQTPDILFHSQLPKNKPTVLVRNSDDFFPEVPASHPWHIFCNAHNSLLTQHLNVLPDWDMFQTSHPWASFHAAARCVSGGPIYFTDYPGQHDIKLIHQMTAPTPRGRTVILRPQRTGRSTNAYIGYDEPALLKIATYVGFAHTGTSILGIFNCSKMPLSEFINLSDFPGTEEGQYVIKAFDAGRVSKPMDRTQRKSFVALDLDVKGWEILCAHPIKFHDLKQSGKVGVAMLGLVDKMTGPAAVTGCVTNVENNGRLRIWTSLKALGVLGIYLGDLPTRSIDDSVIVMLYGKVVARHCVRRSEQDDKVLEIDVAKAWEESGEEARWSNEVSIEIVLD